ncbi:MAG: aspartate 1-decarboxylase [Bacteroidales bacterium]|nr:aspartate 1-decarboxylase [Bacteroidales bacterium]
MTIEVLKSKIHRVTVTEADLDYIGSITIDEALMEAAGIIENERVDIYNITNGERFATYAIRGERGSGVIGINGAAAHKAMVGHLLIIASYAQMTPEEAAVWHPTVIFPKENRI